MSFIILLFFGALVGWVANRLLGGNRKSGLLGNIVLGMIGSAVGGWVMSYFGKPGITGFNCYSIFVGVFGAIVVVLAYRAISGERN